MFANCDFDELSCIKIVCNIFYLPKCYLELPKGLLESMPGGPSLPVLDFNESAHIELVSNNFQLSKMSKISTPEHIN